MVVDLTRDSVWSAAQDAAALRSVFEAITVESCPRSFNFHIHTVCSDGKLQPEQVVAQAMTIGLQGLAITDHHSVNGYRKAQQWLENWRWSAFNMAHSGSRSGSRSGQVPTLWTGMEINAELLRIEVHILAYAFDPDCVALRPYQQGGTVLGNAYQAERVIESIHAAGGLAVLAHPARYRLAPAALIAEAARLGIDGIETYYAYSNPSPWTPSLKQMKEVGQLGADYQLLQTCGTDTHGMNLLQRL